MNSLKGLIIEYARTRQGDWFNGGSIEVLAGKNGYKASNASRRARELCNSGILERRLNEQRCVEYKWKEQDNIIAGVDFSKELKILNLL